jgi:hypothetical protein
MTSKTKGMLAFIGGIIMTGFFFVCAQSAFADNLEKPNGIGKKNAALSGKIARIILALDNSESMCLDLADCLGAMNNDPTNKRIDGAHAFVDSTAQRCPTCEIGIIIYVGVTKDDSTNTATVSEIVAPL